MQVVCFYVDLDPRTEQAIRDQAPDAEFVNTSRSDMAYYKELEVRWTGEDDLMVIEQDMDLRGCEVESFSNCPLPWCVFTYDYGSGVPVYALGCTKFSAELQHKTRPLLPARWQDLDSTVVDAINRTGQRFPHNHGMTGHHHAFVP